MTPSLRLVTAMTILLLGWNRSCTVAVRPRNSIAAEGLKMTLLGWVVPISACVVLWFTRRVLVVVRDMVQSLLTRMPCSARNLMMWLSVGR